MSQTNLTSEEIASRAEALYRQNLRDKVESDERNVGKIILIDVRSGDYELDDTGIAASGRLRARHPDAEPYAIRIGYDAVYRFGGAPRRVKR